MEEDNCVQTALEKMAEILKERGYEYELDPEWQDGTLVYKDKADSFHECWKAGSSDLVNVIITVTPEQALSVDDLNGIIDENAKLREQIASFRELSQDMVIFAGAIMKRHFARRLRELGVEVDK